MFAVIKTGGKQYRVVAEDVLRVDRLKAEPGTVVEFGEVLVVGGDEANPAGPFHAAIEVIDSGLLQKHGIVEVGWTYALGYAAEYVPSPRNNWLGTSNGSRKGPDHLRFHRRRLRREVY